MHLTFVPYGQQNPCGLLPSPQKTCRHFQSRIYHRYTIDWQGWLFHITVPTLVIGVSNRNATFFPPSQLVLMRGYDKLAIREKHRQSESQCLCGFSVEKERILSACFICRITLV